jgi:hypothetical protein
VVSKLFEKLVLKRIKIIIKKDIVPMHQFGFREKHSTTEQVNRLTDVIENTLQRKKICATILLDVKQAFDKVCHKGLMTKQRSCYQSNIVKY